MATAELTVTANLAGLRAQLESIPGITADAATKMVAQLDKSNRAAERAAKQSAEATKKAMQDAERSATKAAGAVSDVGDRFGAVGSSAGKLAGALGLVNPALGEAARTVADLADVGEVGASAVGALGIAVTSAAAVVAVLAAGMLPLVDVMQDQAQRAEAARVALEDYSKAAEAARVANDTLAGSIASASDTLKVSLGLEDARVLTAQRQAAALREQAAASASAQQEEIDRAAAVLESSRGEQAALELRYQRGALDADEAQRLSELRTQTQAITAATTERNQRIRDTIATADTLAEALVDVATAEAQAERNARAKADADRAATEASRAALEVERQRVAAQEALSAMVQGYAEGMRQLVEAQLVTATEEERILAAGAERIRQLDELAVKTSYLATTQAEAAAAEAEAEAARVAVRQDTESKLAALEKTAADERKKLRQGEEDEALAFQEQVLAARDELISMGVDALIGGMEQSADHQADVLARLTSQLESNSENMTESDKDALKQRIADQRQAAIAMFNVTKAAKLAEAVVNTAAAVTQALGSAPPPLSLINAGIAGAAGGAQIAAIAAQQPAFHSGGMVPDEVPARLVAGEAVLSRVGRNVIGDEQIRAANAGMQPMERPLVVVQQYRHRVYNDFARDNLRLGGPLASAVRGSRVVGMREAL
jgi:hypothetical protein